MHCNGTQQLGSSGRKTGLWLEELAAPYFKFKEAGYKVKITSVKGGKVPLDPRSLEEDRKGPHSKKFLESDETKNLLNDTESVRDVKDVYDILYLPGGHGTMWDFTTEPVKETVKRHYKAGKVLSSVCHGPAGFIKPEDDKGEPIVKGKKVTSFSNSEEKSIGDIDAVPFLLEDALKERGALYQKGPDWGSFVVVDEPFVTGPNPQSAEEVGEATVKLAGK
ncbi:hypothetical protein KFL_007010070 [Klebsormidium nitens]|uniref:DJ-1/PfpI domain-containing protein n=1 Tax=Klebsormidium nitens TaxID=105231 RepID=A0A1Y1ILA2_KLENI|nr:hypothetical protein KFL_007010070 [Klebsormidium nitens]|eukprot:GAQ90912.1 hypothetical protein KFL_007010070 [Klebsormidium nitens]